MQLISSASNFVKSLPIRLPALCRVLSKHKYRSALFSLNSNIKTHGEGEPSSEDITIAKRIIDSYHAQKQEYKGLSSGQRDREQWVYGLNRQWEAQVVEHRREYLRCLDACDACGLSRLLCNFFRNPGATGITVPTDYYRKRRHLIANAELVLQVSEWYEKLSNENRSGTLLREDLFDASNVGNPFLVDLDGFSMHSGSLLYLAHVYEMLRHVNLRKEEPYLFVDLGAGFGGIIKFLLQIFPRSKAVVFDIPEILIYSSYYLTKALRDKRVGYQLDSGSIGEALRSFDLLLLPPWKIEGLAPDSVTLFINTNSLPEMSWDAAVHYLRIIKQAVKPGGYFYTFNRWLPILMEGHAPEHGLKELLEAASTQDSFESLYEGTFLLDPSPRYKKLVLRKCAPSKLASDGLAWSDLAEDSVQPSL